ncbi:DUF2249 domain-containing protein [Leucobacter soli]|uniref:DUF2249 domain-containing protein n=1 Tax=Leucobacter soli TaxID=2812850 RepID=A0A916JVE2_9MICO|nr:DUF2249 domain-containing protein [Leucobacter soli]CAG7606036.1 hypothetical protein LEUCIP111803_00881 [Leucobacter soli]
MSSIEIHRNREDAGAAGGTGCACGGHDEGTPEVDVQTIPHAVRHAAIFGMLDGIRPGFALILSATHDPVPLLQQLDERSHGIFDVEYLDRGPERWRLHIRRRPVG